MSKEKKSIAQTMGITRTVIRPREECDIQLREDRIGKYFRKYLNKFVFVEFSEEFMQKSKAGDLMRGVPIPLRKKEIKDFAGGEGIDMLVLAENAEQYSTKESFDGEVMATQRAALQQTLMEEQFPNATPLLLPDFPQCVMSLMNGD